MDRRPSASGAVPGRIGVLAAGAARPLAALVMNSGRLNPAGRERFHEYLSLWLIPPIAQPGGVSVMRRRESPWRRHRSRPIRRGSPAAWRGAPRRRPVSARPEDSPAAPPWNTLATNAPPGFRTVSAKANAVLGQRDDAQMVGRGMAGRGRRHVAEHEIGRAAERLADLAGGGGVGEIALQHRRAGDRVGRVQVDADDGAAPVRPARPRPASSRPAHSRDRRRGGRAPADESARRAGSA